MVIMFLLALISLLACRKVDRRERWRSLVRRGDLVLPVAMTLMYIHGCTSSRYAMGGTADDAVVTGQVAFRERFPLPEGSVATISLHQRSTLDKPGRLLGEAQVVTSDKNLPLEWVIYFDRGEVDDDGKLYLDAKIETDGKLMFVSLDYYEVNANFPGWHEVVVRRVRGEDEKMAQLRREFVEKTWVLESICGEEVSPDRGVFIRMSNNGKLTGSGGCNKIMGGFEINDNGIDISENIATTLASCQDNMQLENALVDVLRSHDKVDLRSGKMVFLAQGRPVATFTMQEDQKLDWKSPPDTRYRRWVEP